MTRKFKGKPIDQSSLFAMSQAAFVKAKEDIGRVGRERTGSRMLRYGCMLSASILLPYSVELMLKFMLSKENDGEFEQTHSLDVLYHALSESSKESIIKKQGMVNVSEILVEHRNSHTDWRYPFGVEDLKLEPLNLERVWKILKDVARQM